MQLTSPSGLRRLTFIAGALLGLSMLLLIRRYAGIDHDSALYLGTALAHHAPQIFAKDLFFLHGSQGSFTLFPWLLSQSFYWFSASDVFLWGTLAGMLCFAGAGWYCLSALLPERQRYWAWLGVLCLPPTYGKTAIFKYGETFLTPRPFAEAFCLLGIGLLARGRWKTAAACAAIALLLHPLQAIAAILIVWPWLVLRDRRWLHALWLAIPVATLGFSGIKPFNGLFAPIDAVWLQDLQEMTSQLFVTRWSHTDYRMLALDALLLGFAWKSLRGPFAAWCMAGLIGLALGLAANLVLVDWLHLQLPTALQVWRAHWVAHWLAMAAFAALLLRDFDARDVARALCLAITGLLAWKMVGWIWLVFALLYASWPRLTLRLQPRMQAVLGGLFVIGLLLMLARHASAELLNFRDAHYRLDLYAIDRSLLAFPLLALGLPLLGWQAWTRMARTRLRLLMAATLAPLLIFSLMTWDGRTAMTLAVERNEFNPDLFSHRIPEDAQVFWDEISVIGPWLALGRADYFSLQQLSGAVFNRETGRSGRQRLLRVRQISEESLYCRLNPTATPNGAPCRVSEASLLLACAPGPIPRPDYLILPYQQRQRFLGTWSIPDPATGQPAATYWLYSCDQIWHAEFSN